MRGKVSHCGFTSPLAGITPAYAGKRLWKPPPVRAGRDHPRVCGEKMCCTAMACRRSGSPPRMRGKVAVGARKKSWLGITPAYAGKSGLEATISACVWDHPRVCGEKSPSPAPCTRATGSPPRMRGKDKRAVGMALPSRITPAYAGKRLKRSRSTVPPVAIVPLFPSVCNKPVVSDGSPAGRDAPLFLPAENAVPASPACNLRSL